MRMKMALASGAFLVAGLVSGMANAEPIRFTLINSSSYVITQLQISPVSQNDWGENFLGRDVVLQGEQGTVTIADGLTTCHYDMLITFNDGATVEERDYDFCDLDSYEVTD